MVAAHCALSIAPLERSGAAQHHAVNRSLRVGFQLMVQLSLRL